MTTVRKLVLVSAALFLGLTALSGSSRGQGIALGPYTYSGVETVSTTIINDATGTMSGTTTYSPATLTVTVLDFLGFATMSIGEYGVGGNAGLTYSASPFSLGGSIDGEDGLDQAYGNFYLSSTFADADLTNVLYPGSDVNYPPVDQVTIFVSFQTLIVPEPSSIVLAASGAVMAAILVCSRRRFDR